MRIVAYFVVAFRSRHSIAAICIHVTKLLMYCMYVCMCVFVCLYMGMDIFIYECILLTILIFGWYVLNDRTGEYIYYIIHLERTLMEHVYLCVNMISHLQKYIMCVWR